MLSRPIVPASSLPSATVLDQLHDVHGERAEGHTREEQGRQPDVRRLQQNQDEHAEHQHRRDTVANTLGAPSDALVVGRPLETLCDRAAASQGREDGTADGGSDGAYDREADPR